MRQPTEYSSSHPSLLNVQIVEGTLEMSVFGSSILGNYVMVQHERKAENGRTQTRFNTWDLNSQDMYVGEQRER